MIHNSDIYRKLPEITVKSHKECTFVHTTSILNDRQHKVKAFPVVCKVFIVAIFHLFVLR